MGQEARTGLALGGPGLRVFSVNCLCSVGGGCSHPRIQAGIQPGFSFSFLTDLGPLLAVGQTLELLTTWPLPGAAPRVVAGFLQSRQPKGEGKSQDASPRHFIT